MTVLTLDLEGRHAVVTGAGSGIGLAVCGILTSRGAHVIGLDLNANALERASREGLLDVAIPTDVADREAVRLAAVQVASAGRPLDMLVNAAGILVRGGVEDLDDEAWDRQFAVNVKSVFHTTREFLPALRLSSHASVVNVGSDASTGGERGAGRLRRVEARGVGPHSRPGPHPWARRHPVQHRVSQHGRHTHGQNRLRGDPGCAGVLPADRPARALGYR